MFAPNSIQSLLLSREDEDDNNLLSEVNSTLESLQKWKEEQKRLDEDLEKQLEENRKNRKIEINEETYPEVEFKEPSLENLKCEPISLVKVKDLNAQTLISVPGIRPIENYDLFRTGEELNKVLTEWNSELDSLNLNLYKTEKKSNEWDQVNEIEKELAELEEMIEGVDIDPSD